MVVLVCCWLFLFSFDWLFDGSQNTLSHFQTQNLWIIRTCWSWKSLVNWSSSENYRKAKLVMMWQRCLTNQNLKCDHFQNICLFFNLFSLCFDSAESVFYVLKRLVEFSLTFCWLSHLHSSLSSQVGRRSLDQQMMLPVFSITL